jgi:rSAM/selenodomain-associated transferase 2
MLSIIIPVLNEAENIVSALEHLTKNGSTNNHNIAEIIFVDGGSEDDTVQLIKEFTKTSSFNILLITSEKGRAKQMNTGSKKATGDILYFLHADSYPPKNFDTLIISEVKKGNPAGCFKMKFKSDHWWLRLASWLTQFSWRACRGGDQSQFITRELFDQIGGFDESYIIYEDNILINELYKRKKFIVIQEWIGSSARMYDEKGVWYVQYHFLVIYVKKWFGADAEKLFTYYKKNIKQSRNSTVIEEAKLPTVENIFADE